MESKLLEIWSYLIGSGIFLAILGLFYKLGKHEQKIDNKFEDFSRSLNAIETHIQKIDYTVHEIDKKSAIMEYTLTLNRSVYNHEP